MSKPHTKPFLIPVLIASILTIQLSPSYAQDCAELLPQGAYNFVDVNSRQLMINEAMSRICSLRTSSSQKARDMTADIPLGDSGLVLGFKNHDADFSSWREQACQDFYEHDMYYSVASDRSKLIPDRITDIIQSCTKRGIYGTVIKRPGESAVFDFALDFSPEGAFNGDTVNSLRLRASNMTCDEFDVNRTYQLRAFHQGVTRPFQNCRLDSGAPSGSIAISNPSPSATIVNKGGIVTFERRLEMPKPTLNSISSPVSQSGDRFTYTVSASVPGKYILTARLLAQYRRADGHNDNTARGSTDVIVNGRLVAQMAQTGNHTWDAVSDIQVPVVSTSGDVRIEMRSRAHPHASPVWHQLIRATLTPSTLGGR